MVGRLTTLHATTSSTALDVGKDALDRLALSIGGKTIFGLAFRADLLPAFLEHQDWKYRHAALSCISQIAEGCEKQMKQRQHLEQIVDQVLPSCRPRLFPCRC